MNEQNPIVREAAPAAWVTVLAMLTLALAACGIFTYFAAEFVEIVKAMFS